MKSAPAIACLSLVVAASAFAEEQRSNRLPPGYHRGRCLLVVRHEERINGKCFFRRSADNIHIDGPRQVFGGVDTVERGGSALTYSRDWWAEVMYEDGRWSGYGNEGIKDVHGGRQWVLQRGGACFVGKETIVGDEVIGEDVKLCLWEK